MNEHVEKLVRIAIEAGAMCDVTFEAGGDMRVNIYPREPQAEQIMDCDLQQRVERLKTGRAS